MNVFIKLHLNEQPQSITVSTKALQFNVCQHARGTATADSFKQMTGRMFRAPSVRRALLRIRLELGSV